MREIIIIGSGGFAREVQWLIERINEVSATWKMLGFTDKDVERGTMINGLPVLGDDSLLAEMDRSMAVVCAIGDSSTRRSIIAKLEINHNLYFPNLVDPSVIMSRYNTMGMGIIICAGSILTVNICIGNFAIINLCCTVGHDVKLNEFVTVYPGVNLSGNIVVEQGSQIGTGVQIIQGKNIGKNAYIGAGAVVVRDVESGCKAVGCPARPM